MQQPEVARPAGGRRFFWTVLAFALANAAAWAAYVALTRPTPAAAVVFPPLKVERFDPGNGQTVWPKPTFRWVFNADVGPAKGGPVVNDPGTTAAGKAAAATAAPSSGPPGSISPPVAGTWAWSDARTLTFVPMADLPQATRFTLTLRPQRLTSAAASPMADAFAATVQTQPLTVHAVRHVGRVDDEPVLEVTFSDAVLAADVLSHVSAVGPDGKPRPLRLHGEPKGKVVRLRCQLQPGDNDVADDEDGPVALNGSAAIGAPPAVHGLRLRVAAGLAGTSGPLALERPAEFPVRLASELSATGAAAHCPPDGEPYLGLTFNGTPDPEKTRKLIRVEPAVAFKVTRPESSSLRLVGAFNPGTRYAITIDPPPGGRKPMSAARDGGVPKPGTFSVFVPDRPSAVWLDHDEGYLGSKGNRTLMAHAVNVAAVRVTVTRVYDTNLVAWRNANDRRRWAPDVSAFARPVASRKIDLGGAKNAVRDVHLSLDELLPPAHRSDGVYRITLAAEAPGGGAVADADEVDDDWAGSRFGRGYGRRSYGDASAIVTLSDVGLSAKRGPDGGVSTWAVSLSTGKPMVGVRVRLFSDKSQVLATATTDADGLATLPPNRPAPGEHPAVLIADTQEQDGRAERQDRQPGGARVVSTALASESGGRDEASGDPTGASSVAGRGQLTWLDLRTGETSTADADVGGAAYARAGYEAFVYTDRGVYRPGETVRLRAIVRGPGQAAPSVSFPLKWQFRRPDLRDWRSDVTPLDADGAAGVDLALPADLPTGRWTAQVGLAGESRKPHAVFGLVTFQVEEYIPERIKATVDVKTAQAGTAPQKQATAAGSPPARLALADAALEARLEADYLFGKPAGNLATTMVATLEPTRFEAKDWRGWAFGDTADFGSTLGRPEPARRRAELPAATTNDRGLATWPLDLKALHRGDQQAAEREKMTVSLSPDAPRGPRPAEPGTDDGYRGPWTLNLVGSVREDGGRAVTTTHTVPVDAAPHYLGLRPTESSPRAGAATAVSVAVVRPTGEASAADVSLVATLFREEWNTVLLHEQGRYRYQSTRKLEPVGDPQGAKATAGRGRVEVTPPQGGHYVLVVRDPKANVESSLSFYAVEPAWQENISREDPEKIDLVLLPPLKAQPLDQIVKAIDAGDVSKLGSMLSEAVWAMADAASPPLAGAADGKAAPVRYRVGQQARVLIRSPFAGRLLVCVETDGIVSRRVVDMAGSQVIVPVDVTDACRPNAYVTATVVRPIDPEASWRAHRASGVVRLPLDPSDRKLAVAVDAPAEIRPETTLSGEVRVTDDAGAPVAGAAVTVAAVDEGILQLTHFKTPDPLAFFLWPRALGVTSADLYGMLMPEVAKPKPDAAVGGDTEGVVFGSAGSRRTNPISAKRVRSVALATGVLHTDAAGRARVELPVPAFAGRLRLMAVAYTAAPEASRQGSGEAGTAVRGPLLVQTSWPRFAAPGDRFLVPVTVFNNTDRPGSARLRLTVEGDAGHPSNVAFVDASGQPLADPSNVELPPLAVPAGGQVVASVRVVAADAAGVAKIRLIATLAPAGDGNAANAGVAGNGNAAGPATAADTFNESLELSVRPPNPSMTDGGFASATPDAPAKVSPPGDLLPGTGHLQLRVTPWPSLSIPRGLDYLDRYPYGCAEQTTSTAFPLVYLGDLGAKYGDAGRFDRARIADKVQVGVLRLIGMQTADGGLAMWPGGRESWPWASVYAVHFLLEAQAAGHAVPEDFRDRLLGYCRTLLERGGDEPTLVEAQAYACHVLAVAGKPPRATMSRLSELLAKPMPTDESRQLQASTARWHLATAWLAAGRRDLAAGLVPAVLPKPREGRQQGGNLASTLGDRATLLSTLLVVDPTRPEVASVAQEVADRLSKERYLSTHEAAQAVCALGKFARSMADVPAYDGVELWAGDVKLASADKGQPLAWDLPAGQAAPAGLEVRVVKATGDGNANAVADKPKALAGEPKAGTPRAFVAWIQTGVPLKPPAAADAGLKVRRRYLDLAGKELDLTKLASGDLVSVEVTVSSATSLDNVVVEDLLPAGLEVENPRLQSGWAVAAGAVGAAGAKDVGADGRRTPERPNPFRAAFTDVRDDRVVIVGRLTSGSEGAVTYLARAVAPGTFVVPPVRAECMYDGGVQSVWGGGTLTVRGGEAVRPPDAGKVAGAAPAE